MDSDPGAQPATCSVGAPQLPPRTFAQVFQQELGFVRKSRELRTSAAAPSDEDLTQQLIGLAFSGGGIRSATFNLGVLQALAERRLFRYFDYISTVSGGGYIGAWLSTWIHRLGGGNIEELLTPAPYDIGKPVEPHPVRFLRNFSNYLTPRVGPVTADTWAFIASYLTNTVLNLTVLVSALGAILLVPHTLVYFFNKAANTPKGMWVSVILLFAITLGFVGSNLSQFVRRTPAECERCREPGRHRSRSSYSWWSQPGPVVGGVAFPILSGAFLATCFLWLYGLDGKPGWPPFWVLGGAAVYATLWSFGWLWGAHHLRKLPRSASGSAYIPPEGPESGRFRRFSRPFYKMLSRSVVLVSAAIAGAVGGALLYLHTFVLFRLSGEFARPWNVVAWGVPLTVLIFQTVAVLHLGLMGRNFPDEMREWWARVGGWLLRVNLMWIISFAVVIFSPLFLRLAWTSPFWGKVTALSLGSGWLVSTLAGLGLGRQVVPADLTRLRRLAMRALPILSVAGIAVALSLALFFVLPGLVASTYSWHAALDLWRADLDPVAIRAGYWAILAHTSQLPLLLPLGFSFLIAWILSFRVDINEFSMHLRYRNRLVRCYLGASNLDRKPQPFTGFDPTDDLPLACLGEVRPGPYPILNATLNVVAGKELAFQKRKARSFVFTPYFCGYDLYRRPTDDSGLPGTPVERSAQPAPSYCPTREYGSALFGPDGLMLGTAMAVSGAATSPNMGYRSSPWLAFLMTIFNARIGMWLGNPRWLWKWREPGPHIGLKWLLYELFGQTHEDRDYIYVSDGGHFENLAIYELVKRRCRLIVASDAGHDPDASFSDLCNAIEMCRVDHGVEIDLDLAGLRPGEAQEGPSRHFAVGNIRYSAQEPPGKLIYLKTTLNGDEPLDVLAYHDQHPRFPNEPTTDQWFDESQFECYRALGYHIASEAADEINNQATLVLSPPPLHPPPSLPSID